MWSQILFLATALGEFLSHIFHWKRELLKMQLDVGDEPYLLQQL